MAREALQPLTLAVLFLGIAVLFWGYSLLQSAPQHKLVVTVSATGTVTAVPAQAVIYLYANATGDTFAGAAANLSSEISALNSTLMPLVGNNSSRIQTTSYSIYAPGPCYNITPNYYPRFYCRPVYSPTFFVATESVAVTLPDSGVANQALEGLSAVPGVTVSNVAAQLSPVQKRIVDQQALSLAMSNATAQAEALAGGESLSVVNISISGYVYPVYGVSASASKVGNQTFYPGTTTVTKSVFVVFRAQ